MWGGFLHNRRSEPSRIRNHPSMCDTERVRPNRRSTREQRNTPVTGDRIAAEGSLHLAALHRGKSDRILVTFHHSNGSFEILFNSLNDIEFIGALLSCSCNIRARRDVS